MFFVKSFLDFIARDFEPLIFFEYFWLKSEGVIFEKLTRVKNIALGLIVIRKLIKGASENRKLIIRARRLKVKKRA